jgi:hypothetical protein
MWISNGEPDIAQPMCMLTGNPTTTTNSAVYPEVIGPRTTLPVNDTLETMSFTVPLEFASDRPISLACYSPGDKVTAGSISLTALRVENLTRQQ